jgi:hypothetical protein
LLAFARGARIFAVHVDAIGTAIDLRGAHLHQFDESRLETALSHVSVDGRHGL